MVQCKYFRTIVIILNNKYSKIRYEIDKLNMFCQSSLKSLISSSSATWKVESSFSNLR